MSASKRPRANTQRPSHITCRTCRTRKIKCGKQRPSCQQCLQANRECEGYDSWEVVVRDDNVDKSPLMTSKAARDSKPDSICTTPSAKTSNVRITAEMRNAFDHFRYCNYVKYAQRGYPTLWASYAISICLNEPAVFFGLASLGALEASIPRIFHSSLARPMDNDKMKLALRLHAAAIAELQEAIPRASRRQGSLDPVIFSCLLFIIFEGTRGNTLNAMRHARTGNSILNERLGLSKPPAAQSHPGTVGVDSSGTSPVLSRRPSVRTESTPPRPDSQSLEFLSPEEARDHLEACTDAAQEIQTELLTLADGWVDKLIVGTRISPATRFCLANTVSKVVPLPASSRLDERVQDMKRRFLSWKGAFAQLLALQGISAQNALRLQVRYFCASFPIFGCRAASEQWTDALYGDCVATIEAIERLLRQQRDVPIAGSLMQRLDLVEGNRRGHAMSFDEEEPIHPDSGALESPLASFRPHAVGVFEQGILQALCLIACKCRDTALRRKASTVLSRMHWFQTVDSSQEIARFTRAVVALEEHNVEQYSDVRSIPPPRPETYSDTPGSNRFTDAVASLLDSDDAISLSCTRLERDGRITVAEYTCSNLSSGTAKPTYEETWTCRLSL